MEIIVYAVADGSVPVLERAVARIPDRRTADTRVRLSRRLAGYGFEDLVDAGDLHTTPAAAISAWRSKLIRQAAILEEHVCEIRRRAERDPEPA